MVKKSIRTLCLLLALTLVLAVPARAAEEPQARGSIFFASYVTDIEKTAPTCFKVWFDVDANAAIMDVLGVSEIIIYRSSDRQNWQRMFTFHMADYPAMVDYNTTSHVGYVTYRSASPGYYYMADITFYARDSRGTGMKCLYTPILEM